MQAQVPAVARGDSSRFLAAMLQSVQAEIGQLGRFRMAEHAEHSTVIVEVIVVDLDECGHRLLSAAPNRARTSGTSNQANIRARPKPTTQFAAVGARSGGPWSACSIPTAQTPIAAPYPMRFQNNIPAPTDQKSIPPKSRYPNGKSVRAKINSQTPAELNTATLSQ
jgi:hypothetical protein